MDLLGSIMYLSVNYNTETNYIIWIFSRRYIISKSKKASNDLKNTYLTFHIVFGRIVSEQNAWVLNKFDQTHPRYSTLHFNFRTID